MDNAETINVYSFKPFRFELVKPIQSQDLPVGRGGHRIVCTEKYLYVFGGYNPACEKRLIRDMWRFNFATRKWTLCAKDQLLPASVTSAAVIGCRRAMLVYGGTGMPFGYKSSNELHCIKLNGLVNRYSTIEIVGQCPQPMYGQATVLNRGCLYTIGGTTGLDYSCDVHRVNLRKPTKAWRNLSAVRNNTAIQNGTGVIQRYVPEGRYGHEVGFDGTNIYVLGGGTNAYVFSLSDIPAFNIRSKTWQQLQSRGDPESDPQYPQDRRCHAVVQLKTENDTYVFLLGGCQDPETVYKDLWRLQLSTLQWTLIENSALRLGLYFHSTTLTQEGKMYVFGGIEGVKDLNRTNNMHSAWMCIPKLSEISWEAVLHYCQHTKLSKSMLRSLKVPEQFIDRLE